MKKTRYIISGFIFFLFTFMALRHQIVGGGPSGTPPLDSYCPFGAIETFYLYLTSGTFLRRVGYSNLIMLFGLIVIGLLLKSGFCGWICPFGTLQEWIRKIGIKKLGNKKYIPEKLDYLCRNLKYFVLILIIGATIATGRMIFRDWDPFIAFFHFGFGDLKWTAYLVLLIVLFGSFYITRFWCRYLCPLGAIVGLLGKLGMYKIECENELCVECKQCEKLCPMDIKIAKMGRITSVDCISCLDCLEAEDKKYAISLRKPNLGRKLKPALYPFFLLIIFFGVIGVSQAVGIWKTGRGFGRRFYISGILNGESDILQYKNDEPKGDEKFINVRGKNVLITGDMTLEEIETLSSIPSRYLISRLEIPQDVSRNQTLGQLRKTYEFQIQDVRKHLREYLEEYKILNLKNKD